MSADLSRCMVAARNIHRGPYRVGLGRKGGPMNLRALEMAAVARVQAMSSLFTVLTKVAQEQGCVTRVMPVEDKGYQRM